MSGVTVDKVNAKAKATPTASSKPASESEVKPAEVKPANAVARALQNAAASPLAWGVITCTLLAVATGERYWREGDFWGKVLNARESPFPLEEIPKQIGAWQMVEGSESTLDPDVARVAGANSSMIRIYTEAQTGETVNVLILYGLGKWMIGHSPDYCYPYAGFQRVEAMGEFELQRSDGNKVARYRGGCFTKNRLGSSEYVQVLYSLRSGDDWLIDGTTLWKNVRDYPGMFKVQIAGPTTPDLSIESSPSVHLLCGFHKRNRQADEAGISVGIGEAGRR